ncbi:ferritin-like domain-containing protein [Lentzea aerocolonigenes]|uniref:ferritin-like domain-containing protein n=1 Tax=Lentzea aerocolonigenes TaxID=68170 RepID=UPI000696BA97|nr:ferritin-like domain-containing protein [Lentzea aerocolonigenes]
MSVESVQTALGTEHAALWTYGMVSAFLGNQAAAVTEGSNAHRARRDTTERWLRDKGATPNPPAAAYLPPAPVSDGPSALAALIAVEQDTCAAWRGVLERTDESVLRTSALDALTAAAVRATRWRKAAGTNPASITMPGVASG